MVNPDLETENTPQMVSVASWKSTGLKRRTVNTLSAERQPLVTRIGPLAAGWWFGTSILFSHILGMSSSQLTFIFFRGVAQPPTSHWLYPIFQVSKPCFPHVTGDLWQRQKSLGVGCLTHFRLDAAAEIRVTLTQQLETTHVIYIYIFYIDI